MNKAEITPQKEESNHFFDDIVSTDYFYAVINGEDIPHPKYDLYYCESGRFPMLKFQEEIEDLNQYCYELINTISKKLDHAETKFEKQKNEKTRVYVEDFGLFTSYETEMSFQSEVYKWDWLNKTVNASTLTILLYSFIESRMNEVYQMFMEMGLIKKSAAPKNTAKLDVYLKALQSTGLCQDEIENLISFFKKVRPVRNAFAHNDWDSLKSNLSEFKLIEFIEAIVNTFKIVDFIYLNLKR